MALPGVVSVSQGVVSAVVGLELDVEIILDEVLVRQGEDRTGSLEMVWGVGVVVLIGSINSWDDVSKVEEQGVEIGGGGVVGFEV